ncbi:intersectin-2 [Sarcoptes scabiei]|nr:intersectin-2 [Sarcoptes scabiei]
MIDNKKKIIFKDSEWTLLFQGAESKVFEGRYESKSAILKERFVKTYRLPILDRRLTKERIKAEIKAYDSIEKKCKLLSERMPKVLYSDDRNIILTRVDDSISLSQHFIDCEKNKRSDSIERALIELGELVAEIHKIRLIHGDLTTSNFLVLKENHSIVPIDFGLSYISNSDENRAVDLYVLERAIQSTHPAINFEVFLNSYQKSMGTDTINKRLDQVRSRGRKRSMVG